MRELAESAKMQQKMWVRALAVCGRRMQSRVKFRSLTRARSPHAQDTFVPEQGIKFGDKRFWGLLFIILGLHSYNTWRESQIVPEPNLPDGAVRRLPEGGLLMADGSIGKVRRRLCARQGRRRHVSELQASSPA